MTRPLLPAGDDLARRLSGSPLAVMLDVDGTLAPIAPRPDEAAVPPETRQVLAALAESPGVQLALVSGRGAADAARMVSVSPSWVIGNHGYEVVSPAGEEQTDPRLAGYRAAIAQAALRLAPDLAPLAGVVLEDKGWTLSVHYRLADPSIVPALRDRVVGAARALGLEMTEGKKVFELRPPAGVDKGTAVVALALRLGALAPGGSALFMGDDRTDEDAFRALRARSAEAVTVRVTPAGIEETAAEFTVRDPDGVREFLSWLAERRAPG